MKCKHTNASSFLISWHDGWLHSEKIHVHFSRLVVIGKQDSRTICFCCSQQLTRYSSIVSLDLAPPTGWLVYEPCCVLSLNWSCCSFLWIWIRRIHRKTKKETSHTMFLLNLEHRVFMQQRKNITFIPFIPTFIQNDKKRTLERLYCTLWCSTTRARPGRAFYIIGATVGLLEYCLVQWFSTVNIWKSLYKYCCNQQCLATNSCNNWG